VCSSCHTASSRFAPRLLLVLLVSSCIPRFVAPHHYLGALFCSVNPSSLFSPLSAPPATNHSIGSCELRRFRHSFCNRFGFFRRQNKSTYHFFGQTFTTTVSSPWSDPDGVFEGQCGCPCGVFEQLARFIANSLFFRTPGRTRQEGVRHR